MYTTENIIVDCQVTTAWYISKHKVHIIRFMTVFKSVYHFVLSSYYTSEIVCIMVTVRKQIIVILRKL